MIGPSPASRNQGDAIPQQGSGSRTPTGQKIGGTIPSIATTSQSLDLEGHD